MDVNIAKELVVILAMSSQTTPETAGLHVSCDLVSLSSPNTEANSVTILCHCTGKSEKKIQNRHSINQGSIYIEHFSKTVNASIVQNTLSQHGANYMQPRACVHTRTHAVSLSVIGPTDWFLSCLDFRGQKLHK